MQAAHHRTEVKGKASIDTDAAWFAKVIGDPSLLSTAEMWAVEFPKN